MPCRFSNFNLWALTFCNKTRLCASPVPTCLLTLRFTSHYVNYNSFVDHYLHNYSNFFKMFWGSFTHSLTLVMTIGINIHHTFIYQNLIIFSSPSIHLSCFYFLYSRARMLRHKSEEMYSNKNHLNNIA